VNLKYVKLVHNKTRQAAPHQAWLSQSINRVTEVKAADVERRALGHLRNQWSQKMKNPADQVRGGLAANCRGRYPNNTLFGGKDQGLQGTNAMVFHGSGLDLFSKKW